MRKYGARKIYENYPGKGEVLELLRMMLGHSTLDMARIYIGIQEEEIDSLYALAD
ncbi:MAG: hypothetical protein MI921_28680 [Cytophagales bacterium]|nr:hypothetical protein [Cytophagales bacterium]